MTSSFYACVSVCACLSGSLCALWPSVECLNKAIDVHQTTYSRYTSRLRINLMIYNFLQNIIKTWQVRQLLGKGQHSCHLLYEC